MATPLSRVMEVLNVLKSQESVFADSTIPFSFCRVGVIQASIALKKDFPLITVMETDEGGNSVEVTYIDTEISDKELYIAGLYAYRNYALKEHDTMRRKAINFKTISFAVSGLTERAKETMRIVWWCDTEIQKVLADISPTVGLASEMGGE